MGKQVETRISHGLRCIGALDRFFFCENDLEDLSSNFPDVDGVLCALYVDTRHSIARVGSGSKPVNLIWPLP